MAKVTRPETTLFLSISVDGRITSHDSDAFDPDQNWKNQPGIRGILQQFYEFSQPHLHVLTTGSVLQKMGLNTRQGKPQPENINLIVLDPDADLTLDGINYLTQNVNHLYLVCLDTHPYKKIVVQGLRSERAQPDAFRQPSTRDRKPEQHTSLPPNDVTLISYSKEIDLNHLLRQLTTKYHVKQLFIHSIAPLNANLLDAGLIDHLSVIISPLLVGGHGTPMLRDLDQITVRPLKLVNSQSFSGNYLNLRYDLVNS